MSSTKTPSTCASLNDRFRLQIFDPPTPKSPIPGKLVLTNGLTCFPYPDKMRILSSVKTFHDFSPDNDPYREHDFGSFPYRTHTILWKIDYYDPLLKYGSDDPTNLTQTIRILTIMLAHEY